MNQPGIGAGVVIGIVGFLGTFATPPRHPVQDRWYKKADLPRGFVRLPRVVYQAVLVIWVLVILASLVAPS